MTWGSPRMLVAFTLATAATVALVAVLATGTWWALPIALAGHIAALVLVMRPVYGAMSQQEKPDPVAEARLEEEGRGPTGEHAPEPERGAGPAEPSSEGDEPRMAI